ncbi:hypothetical protein [Microbacterium sp. GXF7504]
MSATELSALLTVCLLATGAVLALRTDGLRDRGPRGVLLRYAAVGGVAGMLCALMTLAEERGGTVLALALANGAMVFAPAVLWVALRRLNGRSRAAMAGALLLSGSVAATAPLLGGAGSGVAKSIALTVVCVLAAVEAWTQPVSRLVGARAVQAVAVGYGLYSALRVVAVSCIGDDAVRPGGALSPVSTLVSVAAVALLSLGIGRMAADLGRAGGAGHARIRDVSALRAWVRERFAAGEPVTLVTLSLPDLPLIRIAHGPVRAASVEDALCRAVREVAPETVPVAALPGGVVLVPLLPTEDNARQGMLLRRRFEESTPLVAYEDLPEIAVSRAEPGDEAAFEAYLRMLRRGRGAWVRPV